MKKLCILWIATSLTCSEYPPSGVFGAIGKDLATIISLVSNISTPTDGTYTSGCISQTDIDLANGSLKIKCPGIYEIIEDLTYTSTKSEPMISIEANNVTLKGNSLTLNGENIAEGIVRISANSMNLQLINTNFINSNSHGIIMENCNNNSISQASCSQNAGNGILLHQVANCTIYRVDCTNNMAHGIEISSSENCSLLEVASAGYSSNTLDGIFLNSSITCFINNIIANLNTIGIHLDDSSQLNYLVTNEAENNSTNNFQADGSNPNQNVFLSNQSADGTNNVPLNPNGALSGAQGNWSLNNQNF